MIRLGIDATSVAPDGKGIARVQRGTVRALAELDRFELVVYARHPEELPEVRAERVTSRLTLAWEQVGLARARARWTSCSRGPSGCRSSARGRFVVWMFEPPTHRIEQNRRVGARLWQRGSDVVTSLLWRRSLGRAALVFTGSQATADAVRDVAAARPLYPGLDKRFSPGSTRDGSVLHIGSNDPRDDTPTALAAARAAGERLVVVGGYAGPADGAQVVGRVTNEELVDLYRRATLVDTSLYEGFGFPLLEAMACGTPVVASDTTSIPELVGDAALLCPPGDVDAFAAALRRLRSEDGLADELRRRGLARAGGFTWERTAQQLADASMKRRARDRLRAGPPQLGSGRGVRRRARARAARARRGCRAALPRRPGARSVRGARCRGRDFRPRCARTDDATSTRAAAAAPGDRPCDRRLSTGQLAARLAGVRRLFVTHHTPELPRRDNLAGRAWQRLGWLTRPEVVYTSETDRAFDDRRLRTHVVQLGIELDRFASGRRILEGRVVGNVARLAEQKGHRDLVAAAPRVLERHPDVRFVVAGDGELRAELQELAAPLGDRFELLGARRDVPDLLASFEVFAFPSHFEGLCLAVIEAQAAGVPVVATPVGGIRETVVEGETGYLVPVGDPQALAERISWCLEHAEEARCVADEARTRVAAQFDVERMVAETLALYGIS